MFNRRLFISGRDRMNINGTSSMTSASSYNPFPLNLTSTVVHCFIRLAVFTVDFNKVPCAYVLSVHNALVDQADGCSCINQGLDVFPIKNNGGVNDVRRD